MSEIKDFVIEYIGTDYPDYFPGYGVGPDVRFTYCTYGMGTSEEEALDDCLEALSQMIDLDEATELRIIESYTWLGLPEVDTGEYHYIGIKWV